jgi:hypothetical protein
MNLKQIYQTVRTRIHDAPALVGAIPCVALFVVVVLLMPISLIADDEPTARVFSLDDFSRVAGARGTIERSENEICLGVVTRGLPPGAYTLWGIAFDSPGDCTHGGGEDIPPLPGSCGVGDDGVAATEATGQWMGAFLVGPDGRGHLSSCVELGSPPGQVLFGDGMDNPGAEIHGIIKSHGAALYGDPELLGLQLTHVVGGCFGPPPPPDGPGGPNTDCADLQLVIWVAAP